MLQRVIKRRKGVKTLAMRSADAAHALGISERYLAELTKVGIIPHVRIGRAVLYPVGPLEKWLADNATSGRKMGGIGVDE